MTPDLRLLSGFRPWGVIIIACTCHVSAFRFVAPIWFLLLSATLYTAMYCPFLEAMLVWNCRKPVET